MVEGMTLTVSYLLIIMKMQKFSMRIRKAGIFYEVAQIFKL